MIPGDVQVPKNAKLLAIFGCVIASFALAYFGERVISTGLYDYIERRSTGAFNAHRWRSLVGVLIFSLLLCALTLGSGLALWGKELVRDGMCLRRSTLPRRTLVLYACATPFLSYVGHGFCSLILGAPSEQVGDFRALLYEENLFSGMSLALIMAFAMGPALAEELLFRGLLFGALRRRFSAAIPIVVTSLSFALIQFSPQLVLTILPVSLWLSVIAWKSNSTLVSIAGHGINNAVVGAMIGIGMLRATAFGNSVHLLAWGIGFPLFMLSVEQLLKQPRAGEASASA